MVIVIRLSPRGKGLPYPADNAKYQIDVMHGVFEKESFDVMLYTFSRYRERRLTLS